MYIWRGKQRRDRREYALCGKELFVPKNIITNPHHADRQGNAARDEVLRYEGEIKHVTFFASQIGNIMNGYLHSPSGAMELKLVTEEVS